MAGALPPVTTPPRGEEQDEQGAGPQDTLWCSDGGPSPGDGSSPPASPPWPPLVERSGDASAGVRGVQEAGPSPAPSHEGGVPAPGTRGP